MAGIAESLRALRDVHGVYGSFVLASTGTVVARDLPDAFDDELLGDVGPRVVRLCEALGSSGEELQSVMLRYAEHKLFVRKAGWGVIAVLSAEDVTLPALRMVLNLISRRIDPEVPPSLPRPTGPLARIAGATPAPPGSMPSHELAAPAVEAPARAVAQDGRDSSAPTSDRHVRKYRGRVVDE